MVRKNVFAFDALSVGFAIYLVLSSTSAWGLLRLAAIPSMSFGGLGGGETWRSVGYIGALAVFGLGCLFFPSLFKRKTVGVSTFCFACGFAGLFASLFMPHESFRAAAAFLIGLGSALSFLMWERLFAAQERAVIMIQIVCGSALSALLYLLLANISQLWLYAAIVFLCIGLNAVFLYRCQGDVFRTEPRSVAVAQNGHDDLRNIVSSTWRYMLCIAAIGYASGMTRMFVQQGGGDTLSLNTAMAIGMLVATIALGLFWDAIRKRFSFSALYSLLFFVVTTGFLFLPFFGIEYRLIFAGIANGAFSVASIFMMVTCIRVARLRQIDPIGVFGIFSSIVYGAVLAGRAIGDVAAQFYDISHILIIVLMSVYLLSFAGVIANFRRTSHDDEPLDFSVAAAQELEESIPPAASEESIAPSAPARPLIRNVVVAQDMVPIYSRMIKKTYGLSNRETDVLELIIRGRDVARMAETLFVSENTVRSHCKNLYRKLDVHNRQQVFDLVEEFSQREETDRV